MAQGRVKLLNEDGTFSRWIYQSELGSLMRSDRLVRARSRNVSAFRLKALPPDSESEPSMPMPTVAEMKQYAERRDCPEEIREKVNACRVTFRCRVMDLSGLTTDLLTDGVVADSMEAELYA